MKKRLQKLGRLAAIASISATIVWFGLQITPHLNEADAKIFETIYAYTKAMPEYLFESNHTGKPAEIKINGNQTHLTVQKSRDSITNILNFYATQYQPQNFKKARAEAFRQITNGPDKERVQKIYNFMDCLKADQHFRFQGENYGFWAAFEFKDRGLEMGSCEFNRLLLRAIKSGRVGRMGTFRVTMVLKPDADEKANIINLWTDEDFDLKNLTPDESGDMPGEDIKDVPRYSGARRQLAIEQENATSMDRVAVYEADGSVVNQILFYHSMMKHAGWNTDDSFETAMQENDHEHLMFYKRKGREITIFIKENSHNGKIITTIMDREYKSG